MVVEGHLAELGLREHEVDAAADDGVGVAARVAVVHEELDLVRVRVSSS